MHSRAIQIYFMPPLSKDGVKTEDYNLRDHFFNTALYVQNNGEKMVEMIKENYKINHAYNRLRQVSGLRRDPAVSAEDPTMIHKSH